MREHSENGATSPEDRPILLLFSDDSTLFFARLMRDLIKAARADCPVELCWYESKNALSDRQMELLLPQGPDRILDSETLSGIFDDHSIRAVVTSRVYGVLRKALERLDDDGGASRHRAGRPCLITFLGGLEFFPERGLRNRLLSDAVFLTPRDNIAAFEALRQSRGLNFWQSVNFGHPAALTPLPPPADLVERRDIYFFAQAISPKSRAGRRHMLELLIALAERYPERNIYLKLRNLPEENKRHLHVETYDYPTLLKDYAEVPSNLILTACTMAEALQRAALAITCTSTAALDAISAAVPTMVYLDYVDHFLDPLNPKMRGIFERSGLIADLQTILSLSPSRPDPEWISTVFSQRTLGTELIRVIEAYETRPVIGSVG